MTDLIPYGFRVIYHYTWCRIAGYALEMGYHDRKNKTKKYGRCVNCGTFERDKDEEKKQRTA
jgi:hypothetical protein